MKIAALADFHYAMGTPPGARRSDLAPLLLRRAVARLNRFVKPDVTVLLGDLLDRGSEPDGGELRGRLAKIVGTIESPTMALPGNHDGDAEAFYRDFERPPPWIDVAGVRLVGFDDPEEPRYWARRTEAVGTERGPPGTTTEPIHARGCERVQRRVTRGRSGRWPRTPPGEEGMSQHQAR